jgi:hypothetical protein
VSILALFTECLVLIERKYFAPPNNSEKYTITPPTSISSHPPPLTAQADARQTPPTPALVTLLGAA